MKTSSRSPGASLLDHALSFTWAQWQPLGLSSSSPPVNWYPVDPEALLVWSLYLGRHDARLFDECLDWLASNGDLISTQRIRNIASSWPAVIRAIVDASLDLVLKSSGSQRVEPGSPLFHGNRSEGDSRAEAVFAKYGLFRPPFEPSGKSRRPFFRDPSNIAFLLRLLFGPGTRAEVVRFLFLYGERASTAAVARASWYSKRSVQDSLAALKEGGFCEGRKSAKESEWWIDRERWSAWLNLAQNEAHWLDWPNGFLGTAVLLDFLTSTREPESSYLFVSDARQAMIRAREYLSSLPRFPGDPRDYPGPAYLKVFQDDVSTHWKNFLYIPPQGGQN